jgi:hypothetical protein
MEDDIIPYTWMPGKQKGKYKTHCTLMAPANSILK